MQIVARQGGFENLVETFRIETTRSKLNPYYGTPKEQKFADYCFVRGDGIRVESLHVPQDAEISDHLPLHLKFEFV